MIEEFLSEDKSYDSGVPESEINAYKANFKTIACSSQDKIIKENKFLSTLGFLFTPDAIALNRTYKKADFYRANVFLKNTISPNELYSKLLFMDYHEGLEAFTLNFEIEGKKYSFAFGKKKIE